ncbi:MAG: methyl-accepting chemotaxis protein, partial [Spirochaetota bacterium]
NTIMSIRSELNDKTESSRREMTEILGTVSLMSSEFAEIENVVGLIDDISEKINLLSLNAAIEAARAGEAGRGFAVVSDEISKLADQTAANVKTIGSSIEKNLSSLSRSVKGLTSFEKVLESMIASIEKLSLSIDKISETAGRDLQYNRDIRKSNEQVVSISHTIRQAMEEQKAALGEILLSLTSVNQATQEFASGSRDLAQTGESVGQTIAEMNRIMKEQKS